VGSRARDSRKSAKNGVSTTVRERGNHHPLVGVGSLDGVDGAGNRGFVFDVDAEASVGEGVECLHEGRHTCPAKVNPGEL
jgi:hypothetical protein